MLQYDRDLIAKSYDLAKTRFEAFGVDTDDAIKQFSDIPLSLHC